MKHRSLLSFALGGAALPLLLAACSVATDASPGDVTSESPLGAGSARPVRFGVAPQWYQSYAPPSAGPQNVDAVAVGDWLVENGFTDAHKTKTDAIVSRKKVPYFFGYIATSMTKRGLGTSSDCDGNSGAKLCQEGASYIRAHIEGEILPAYKAAAARIGSAVGGGEALIHIEPDWYQFSEKAQANPFSRAESNGIMNKILGAIRAGCPSCRAVIDFSPWFSPDRTAWATSAADFYAGWDRTVVKYVGLTGKPFPFTEGKIDNFTYGEITTQLGLPLVVIDAYTFGGGPIDVDKTWLSPANLAKAAAMGVAFVFESQQGDVAGYDAFIRSFRGNTPAPAPLPTTPAPAPTPAPPPAPRPPPPAPPPSPPAGSGAVTVTGGAFSATTTVNSVWASGYCNDVHLTNRGATTARWTATVPPRGRLTQSWSSTYSFVGGQWAFVGVDYNAAVAPGQSVTFGYCADTP